MDDDAPAASEPTKRAERQRLRALHAALGLPEALAAQMRHDAIGRAGREPPGPDSWKRAAALALGVSTPDLLAYLAGRLSVRRAGEIARAGGVADRAAQARARLAGERIEDAFRELERRVLPEIGAGPACDAVRAQLRAGCAAALLALHARPLTLAPDGAARAEG